MCLTDAWRIVDDTNNSFDLEAMNRDADSYFGVVAERTVMTEKGLRNAIIYNAAKASKTRKSKIPVISDSKVNVGNLEWNLMVYDVVFDGSKFRFANYYKSLGNKGVVQAVFWCSQSYFDKVRPEFEKLMTGVTFTE